MTQKNSQSNAIHFTHDHVSDHCIWLPGEREFGGIFAAVDRATIESPSPQYKRERIRDNAFVIDDKNPDWVLFTRHWEI